MASNPIRLSSVSLLLLLFLLIGVAISEGAKGRRVSIPDELDDVVDDEEDEAWRQWGQRSRPNDADRFDPPLDLSEMDPADIQAEMMRRHTGPTIGFVKLRPGVRRSRREVPEIAMRWSKVLRTGAIEARFMAVDLNTIMFNMERGQDIEELKEFVLSHPEAYEMKIGEQLYRRPGDPPLDEVIEMLHRKNNEDSDHDPTEEEQHSNDEL